MSKVEVLLATVNDTKWEKISELRIHAPAVVANQTSYFLLRKTGDRDRIIEIATETRGVSINRNLGLSLSENDILLFCDDDLELYQDYEETVIQAFNNDVDVIIFNFKYENKDGTETFRIKRNQRISMKNILKYGICGVAIRKKCCKKYGLFFNEVFGGGSIYGSGEDTLFLTNCVRNKLKIIAVTDCIGVNKYRESTWFKGYKEKFFYDKGALLAACFPNTKWFFALFFTFRMKRLTELERKQIFKLLLAGIKGFKTLQSFEMWDENNKT